MSPPIKRTLKRTIIPADLLVWLIDSDLKPSGPHRAIAAAFVAESFEQTIPVALVEKDDAYKNQKLADETAKEIDFHFDLSLEGAGCWYFVVAPHPHGQSWAEANVEAFFTREDAAAYAKKNEDELRAQHG